MKTLEVIQAAAASPRLLPCPFCGTKKTDVVDSTAGVAMCCWPSGYRVQCRRCGAAGPWDDGPVAALNMWDTRHRRQPNPPFERAKT